MPNLRRLKSLRAFLDTVPKENFNIIPWAGVSLTPVLQDKLENTLGVIRHQNILEESFDKAFASPSKLKASGCGTTACVLGWAAVKPSFRKAGLGFADIEEIKDKVIGTVVYKGYKGTVAGEAFFGIDGITADYLFMPSQYGTKKGLAEVKLHLDRVIRNEGKAPKNRY